MVVAIALAAAAVLAAVVVLAMGRGGELAEVHPDYPPLPFPGDRRLLGMDAAVVRLPRGLWGYHVDATDEMLRRFAHALSERDTRLAILEQQVAELRETARLRDQPPPEDAWYAQTPETPWTSPDTSEAPESFGNAPQYGPEPPPVWPSGHPHTQELSGRGPRDESESGK